MFLKLIKITPSRLLRFHACFSLSILIAPARHTRSHAPRNTHALPFQRVSIQLLKPRSFSAATNFAAERQRHGSVRANLSAAAEAFAVSIGERARVNSGFMASLILKVDYIYL